MRIDPDECRDPDLLAAEVRRLQAVIASGAPTLTDEERLALNFAAEQFSIAVLREQSYKRAPMCLSDAILYQNTITALAILRDLLARLDNKQETP